MERYLHTFVKYQQDNWSKKLAMAEFITNNNKLASTKLSQFFASQDLHSRISFDIVDLSNSSTCCQKVKRKSHQMNRIM